VEILSKDRPGADSKEKPEPVSDIDTGVVDSPIVLDPKRPIREAVISLTRKFVAAGHVPCSSRRHVHHSATGSLVRSGFVMRTSLSENQLF